jgi:predicted ATPase
LTELQSIVARGELLEPSEVILHWFERDNRGQTDVKSSVLGADGSFGDWPEDFGEVQMEADRRYLEAAELHLMGGADE